MHPGAELSLLSLFLVGVWAVCAALGREREREKSGNASESGRERSCDEVGVNTAWFGMGSGVAGGDSRGDRVGRGVVQLGLSRARRSRGIAQGAGNSSEEPFPMLPWPPHREQPLGSSSRSLPRDVRGSWGEAARLCTTCWVSTRRAAAWALVPDG